MKSSLIAATAGMLAMPFALLISAPAHAMPPCDGFLSPSEVADCNARQAQIRQQPAVPGLPPECAGATGMAAAICLDKVAGAQ